MTYKVYYKDWFNGTRSAVVKACSFKDAKDLGNTMGKVIRVFKLN